MCVSIYMCVRVYGRPKANLNILLMHEVDYILNKEKQGECVHSENYIIYFHSEVDYVIYFPFFIRNYVNMIACQSFFFRVKILYW